MTWQTDDALGAVERWATGAGFWMLRETAAGSLGGGRIDALLIPTGMDAHVFKFSGTRYGPGRAHWTDRLGLIGVEVKTSREDFDRGIREQQFEKYAATVSGLYVATCPEVKSAEIPAGLGHLVVFDGTTHLKLARLKFMGGERRCVCKRHPEYAMKPLTNEQAWRLVWAMRKEFGALEHERKQENKDALKRIGDRAARALSALSAELERNGHEQRSSDPDAR